MFGDGASLLGVQNMVMSNAIVGYGISYENATEIESHGRLFATDLVCYRDGGRRGTLGVESFSWELLGRASKTIHQNFAFCFQSVFANSPQVSNNLFIS